MLRTYVIIATTMALGLGATLARADHDRELRYVIGGALIGAAVGELIYSDHRHSPYHVRFRYDDHRRYAHRGRHFHRHPGWRGGRHGGYRRHFDRGRHFHRGRCRH